MAIQCQDLWQSFKDQRVTFFTGVPDSTFKHWLSFVADSTDPALNHVVATNEGEATAIACGYHLATGEVPVVYMQNSGLGNALNPLVSLAAPEVYAIPMVLMVGWRGEPDRHDEPQHLKMGQILLPILQATGIPYAVMQPAVRSSADIVQQLVINARRESRPQALVIRHGVFDEYCPSAPLSDETADISREHAIQVILEHVGCNDAIVATTGKTARELFELREALGQDHRRDFLTVGSMGYASAIALGIALHSPDRMVWVIDGDGAALMHAGNLATAGHYAPRNLRHVILDNQSHDSTGGQPTVSPSVNFMDLAKANGYRSAALARSKSEFLGALRTFKATSGPAVLSVSVRRGSRKDLGRPTTSPTQNKRDLMAFLSSGNEV